LIENTGEFNFNETVKLAVNGDAAAFAELYSRVYKELYYVALYSLKNGADAQDAVSDAVLDAFMTIRKLRDETAFKAWIMKILSAKIKRKFKEYAKESLSVPVEAGETLIETPEPDCDLIDVKREIARLDRVDRLTLSLSVICGYTSAQIAKMTGMNANTVRSRIMRTKEKLREKLLIKGE
jgi:RNA polymerase sigma-70 factor (ECF subfamily)